MLVALHRGNGIVGRLIRWQTRSQYSHASLVFRSGEVYESREFRGVQRLPSMPESEDVDLFEVPDLDPLAEQRVESWAMGLVGARYDYTSVLRFVSRRKASARSRDKWFCSEFVFAAFLEAAGIRLLHRIEAWAVSPALLSLSPLLRQPQDDSRATKTCAGGKPKHGNRCECEICSGPG